MVYLTYIIDHYDRLSSITMFMHAHLITWHNNDLLDSDSSKMVKYLNSGRVIREGYMNMRCHLDPGCPAHIHPATDSEDINVPEATIIGHAWQELFPGRPVPDVLSQPCCAQLAVSRERIRALSKEQYSFFRDWLLASQLEDRLTGRVFEYIWQYIWTGEYEFCPDEYVCYCDGYGVCLQDKDEYKDYFTMRDKVRKLQDELQTSFAREGDDEILEYAASLQEKIDRLERTMVERKEEAFRRGRDIRDNATNQEQS